MSESLRAKVWEPRYADRMAGMQASEIRELLKVIAKPGVISFAGGIPDPQLFPRDALSAAYAAILADPVRGAAALQYSVSEGDPELRGWIVEHMARQGVTCGIENVLITSDSQQALEFIGKAFLSPGDTALVAAPTYLGALQAFAANAPVYDTLGFDGSNRTAASYAQDAERKGGRVSMAYVVPDFANPTGETLSRAQRGGLLELARDLDIALIEDSPYGALRYDGEAEPSLLALDAGPGGIDASRVIQCGSFSKIFTPGLRIGWVCAARDVIARLGLIKQAGDLNSPAINQRVMLHLAREMYDAQVERTVAHYRAKRDAMLGAMEAEMPPGSTWSRPEGGMFVWVRLPEGMDATALLPRAVETHGIAYVPGQAFHHDRSGPNTMRLSFSLPSESQIVEGMQRLGAALRAG